ncbi:hypothetical protein ANCDUO_00603 [Ancylostoma duodenale]|uniref:Pyridoxal-dependent decarboxylase domain protein n=1 Tax=Ancylostoma duodenale TaxID=51022 RepID=A0A0C2DGE8_9BILA|nr:hypothetical protein ANCDUO_00603 [Ancylostoma duodenale]
MNVQDRGRHAATEAHNHRRYSSEETAHTHEKCGPPILENAHSCIEKACKLAMVRYRPIQPTEENQWGITGEQIEEQIKKDIKRDLIPCFINCTLGTTSTASCDKLTSICPVAKKYGTWLHVDAAYAGSTFIDPKYREVA